MAFKNFTFILITFFTLLLLWGLGWLWFATTVAMSAPDSKVEKTDAIVVVTGGNGRINAGLDLLSQNTADKLFISGVNQDVKEKDIFQSWKNPTDKKPCCVYLGYKAENTTGNAVEVKEWVEENNINSFLLVTSSYHMTRANLEISRLLPDKKIAQYPVLTDDFEAWKGRFWTLTFSEYNKTIASRLSLESGNY